MYNEYTDEQLILLVKSSSDERAFTEIYNRYWERLLAISLNRIGDLGPAKDVVQDVFTSLWNNRQLSEVHNLQHYLAAAVKYLTLAYLRKSGKTVPEADTALHRLPADSLESQIDNREILRMIREETDRLPEKCRLIFRYSRDEGLSNKEIAAMLNISPRTVETQISKALRSMRQAFRNIGQMLAFIIFYKFF